MILKRLHSRLYLCGFQASYYHTSVFMWWVWGVGAYLHSDCWENHKNGNDCTDKLNITARSFTVARQPPWSGHAQPMVCFALHQTSRGFIKGFQPKCSYAVDVVNGIIRILQTSNRELEAHFTVVALVRCSHPTQIRSVVDQLYSIPAQQTGSRLVVLHATPSVLQTWWRGRILSWATWRNCTVTPRSSRRAVRCTVELDWRVDSGHNSYCCKHDLRLLYCTDRNVTCC